MAIGKWLLAGLMWGAAAHLTAAPEVRVEGLFKGAAVLKIDGQQVMLKKGRSHSSGVTLVDANAHRAIVEIDGQRHELALHMAMGGTYQQADVTQVVIRKNDNNQYKVNGSINGQPVHFLVDTGANTVAMNEIQARNLGLLYKMDGQESRAVTASGVVSTWVVTLNAVKVGEINVPNVRAVVIEGAYPQEVLLGMSYLEYVKIQEHNSVLMLEKKF
ncbi:MULTISPECIES: TIGR02281 family clan AA aspartic protease [unclassified Ketobacter]|uniref:retropepsin-like aspartic protease family protein n=1 Tax=unclassified Ketobacter TaxID=2639109 RepID=UPI0025BE7EE9|nr:MULTISPECIES: TIGR02281 family clan AA aspartic protease [unclassified Ketobacter]MCK5790762.1 TIGR02281 family clan AA aspartic protease [Ketobacter sp.]MEC8814045.1 TIGR02281 family clan AA aspartic protease [Pseudomonadota bacterium]